jgi:hypothetical protein
MRSNTAIARTASCRGAQNKSVLQLSKFNQMLKYVSEYYHCHTWFKINRKCLRAFCDSLASKTSVRVS